MAGNTAGGFLRNQTARPRRPAHPFGTWIRQPAPRATRKNGA